MPDPLFSDKALQAAKYALDGLSFRQELIGQNLSNVDTPGYKSQTVTFEEALNRALNHDRSVTMNTTHVRHMPISPQGATYQIMERTGGSSRADGNNVDIDVEMVNWLFLHEMEFTGIGASVFSPESATIALKNADGTRKEIYDVWLDLKALELRR